MARPKSKIERKVINTRLEKRLLEFVKNKSEETGIPINRLIEDAIREKYIKELKGE